MKSLKLRPYQVECINGVIGSTLIVLPTGAGKTLIAKGIHDKHPDKKFLFLAPKLNLLEQTAAAFAELNPEIIHGKNVFNTTNNCYVSTIQTISRREELVVNMKFDYIIIDEMHFGSAGKMQKAIKAAHSGHIIGLSATPYDKYGKLLTSGFDTVISKYGALYMVENGYLVDINAINPVKVNLAGVKTTGGDYNLKDLDARVNTPRNIKATVLSTVKHIQERVQTLIFATSINHCENLQKLYAANGIDIYSLHSKMSDEEIADILRRFKAGDIKALVSVNMLTEGFDVPAVDTVVIARPTQSQNLYKQMVGRAMRLSDGKTDALMLDCGNVIENLGMPLEPIRERKKGKARYECEECGSNAPKRSKITHEDAYTYCPVCLGGVADYTGDVDECEKCHSIYHIKFHPESYDISEEGIYLNCSCGNHQCVEEPAEPTAPDEIAYKFPDEMLLLSSDEPLKLECARTQFAKVVRENESEFNSAYPDMKAVQKLWMKYRSKSEFSACVKAAREEVRKSQHLLELLEDDVDDKVARYGKVMFELTKSKTLSTCKKAVRSRIKNYHNKNGRDISDRGLQSFCEYIASVEMV